MKNILFITPNSFRDINGGTILFNEFFKSIGANNKIGWFNCSEGFNKSKLTYNFKFIYFFNDFIFSNYYLNIIARRVSVFGFIYFFLKYNLISLLIVKRVIFLIKKESINKLWVYSSQSSISLIYFLNKRIKINYHLSVQDDFSTHLPGFESYFLKKKFKYVIENASSVDFISSSMEKYYQNLYNIKSKTTIFYISQQSKSIKLPVVNRKISKIGYAGNIWCGPTFIPLLEAIKEINITHKLSLKLLIFGQYFPRKLFNDYLEFIEYKQFKPYESLIEDLQSCDLLYLPMTFNKSQEVINITSFPSKIITYLNSAVPILNHSPKESSTNYFVKQNLVGFSICSLEKHEFTDLLLGDTLNLRKTFSINSQSAIEMFNHDKMVNSLKSLIFE